MHIGSQPQPHVILLDQCNIGADDAGFLQLADPAQGSRRRKLYFFCELVIGHAPVELQCLKNLAIQFIKNDSLVHGFNYAYLMHEN